MKEAIQDYYGKRIQNTESLEHDACCVTDYNTQLLKHITEEVKSRRFGCGSPIPDEAFGLTALDLGCGSGIDVFIAAKLVGPAGKVIGVDMTIEQLDIAQRNIDPIMKNLGYDTPNVEFILGDIESLDVPDDSVDCVISNCVINLSQNKDAVFREIYRVLKKGGEFLIADIVADRRIPEELANNPKLYSECLTGADYEGDFIKKMNNAGFNDVRQTYRRVVDDVIEGIHFRSIVFRGFKIDMEEHCEDYGQVAVYNGSAVGKPEAYSLDLNHLFPAGDPVRICKNTADIITKSRFASMFHVSGEIAHLGAFDCSCSSASEMATKEQQTEDESFGCC